MVGPAQLFSGSCGIKLAREKETVELYSSWLDITGMFGTWGSVVNSDTVKDVIIINTTSMLTNIIFSLLCISLTFRLKTFHNTLNKMVTGEQDLKITQYGSA